LVAVLFTGLRKSGQIDLETIEMATRASMHQAGATALKHLLASPPPAERPTQIQIKRFLPKKTPEVSEYSVCAAPVEIAARIVPGGFTTRQNVK
jgi:hypothetical protein